ncbi:YeiH family protein [Acetobacter conturbans]|uniref:Sulfate exporter family transporter n=1 Tax=Acetobacter conturbans TaxID=1737472 RepID=A0ABX0K0I2_9PROT|nr:putative sulfate exporter family transporter [Acetobacter conturbans]NHN88624.1 putative sulfate exporter family transporter [Acetobacter conturbans]
MTCFAPTRFFTALRLLFPGIGLCLLVTAASYALEAGERALFGSVWLEALVLAILTGTALRSLWEPGPRWHAGIAFSAGYLLEVSVVLLGVSVSAASILAIGPLLILSIALVVVMALVTGFGIGWLLGLSPRMALLVACGNAICGNSAIAAVAPVIRADGKDVAASISFTAVLGIAVVTGLPFLGIALRMNDVMFGAFSGLTVYAVPQVIAATAPLGAVAIQTGTVVKLVRVLMLGPVCFILSLLAPFLPPEPHSEEDSIAGEPGSPSGLFRFLPWFIIGFLVLVTCRSLGLVPVWFLSPASHAATLLTVISMGALGLGVDIRTVARAGGRVTATVILSLMGLGAISYGLLKLLHVG